ncbi:MAG: hypothetical protein ABSA47_03500 [Verrucomicrobiota bacterium]|jgi:hypothetical protein
MKILTHGNVGAIGLRDCSGGLRPPHKEGMAAVADRRYRSSAEDSQNCRHVRSIRAPRGIALVITLLMLSVITFLAVAFLVLTRSQRTSVTATLDKVTAQTMSEAALERAKAEILARMEALNSVYAYDFMVSTNQDIPPFPTNAAAWAVAIAGLKNDPRAPVFVQTNLTSPNNLDYRYWLDLNRNGVAEGSGWLPVINTDGSYTNYAYFIGEPEWIAVPLYPGLPLSPQNPAIGRYCYYVLPIGKTLDLNHIHNYSKKGASTMPAPTDTTTGLDGYARDQDVGSWELNLAALLYDVNTNIYFNQYTFAPGTTLNSGMSFNDAYSFLYFRYGPNFGGPYPGTLETFYPTTETPPLYYATAIDEYGSPARTVTDPWPGGYGTNSYDDIMQDLFDPSKTSVGFTNSLLSWQTNLDSYDRYTLQRLLASIGTGSSPELQTYVYDDFWTNVSGTTPLRERPKVNLNYNNTYDIVNNLNTSPATLAPWTNALAFFTNAAESLVRSQEYPFTNGYGTVWNHFGLTNMPVWCATNASIRYSENLHRMLQLAANFYDATRPDNSPPSPSLLPYPSVFRPLFNYDSSNYTLYIVGYTNMTTNLLGLATNTIPQVSQPFYDLSNTPYIPSNILYNANVWGIPWVVGAVKGLPAFDRFASSNSMTVERKLLFRRWPVLATVNGVTRTNGDPTRPPQYTNQFYCLTNVIVCGLDAWNTYSTNWTRPFEVIASNYITLTLTNQYGLGTNMALTNACDITFNNWRRFYSPIPSNSMIAFLQTNLLYLPGDYFSETLGQFRGLGVDTNTGDYGAGAFLAADRMQWPSAPLPAYAWMLTVTNHVMYLLMDHVTGQIYDFVNLGPFGTSLNFTNVANPQGYGGTLPGGTAGGGGFIGSDWDPTMLPNGMNQGVLNQIWHATNDLTFYNKLLGKGATNNTELYFAPGSAPQITCFGSQTWLVNDPLVHYTLGDLTAPTPNGRPDTNQVLGVNDRYEPWGVDNNQNMTFTDPQLWGSDYWNFPNNKFPSVGWLGRVHRGTPWQTVFLKADAAPANNYANWTTYWVNTTDTYPTNDYALLDLFTATPNDNAATGLLSVNQANSPPWYALLGGVAIPTNYTLTNLYVIDPTTTNVDYIVNGQYGINTARGNGVFRHVGGILAAPALTIGSPLLGATPAMAQATAQNCPDEVVEAIPQQVMGLLKLGQPQFVVYAFGQALKPKELYFGGTSATFNLCTNYQITGEYATRTVFHLVGPPNAANAKIEVDSFNVLPPGN